MTFNPGEVVMLKVDKLYERHGKPVNYYLVMPSDDDRFVKVFEPTSREMLAVFADDLMLVSKRQP